MAGRVPPKKKSPATPTRRVAGGTTAARTTKATAAKKPTARESTAKRPTGATAKPAKKVPAKRPAAGPTKRPAKKAAPAPRSVAPIRARRTAKATAVDRPSGNHHVRPPRTSGPAITERDIDMLRWVGRHGVVSPDQVARKYFSRDGNGTVGKGAAYRRLRKLRELGLLRSDHTFYLETSVLRLTRSGASLADADVGPARLVLAEVHHSLAVVDLTEQLLSANKSATLTTERELRVARRREMAANTRPIGRGRLPDAVLVKGGKKIAVELDLTTKRANDIERILRRYLQERYDEVWWYVRPKSVQRLRDIVRRNRADDMVTVRSWEG